MSFLAVFPSHAVARWIDADLLERERDLTSGQPLDAAPGFSDAEWTRRSSFLRPTRLRYRPFERLLSLLNLDVRSLPRARTIQR